jgi:hypothetical protein
MSYERIHYELHDGFIHTWLVTGPQHTSIEMDVEQNSASWRLKTLGRCAESAGYDLDLTTDPVEPATPAEDEIIAGGYTGRWSIVHCLEDHYVDLSDATQPGQLRAWASTGLKSSGPQRVTFTLTTTDFADVWVNGMHVHRALRTTSGPLSPNTRCVTGAFEVSLAEGINDVVVRFETVTPGPAPFVLALHVTAELAPTVALPTLISPVDRRRHLEAVFQAAYINQYVLARYDSVAVNWPHQDESSAGAREMAHKEAVSMIIRVQTPAGRVYAEAERKGGLGESAEMGFTYKYPNGPLEARLMPRLQEYYEGNMRVTHTIPFWGLDNDTYTEAPAGTFPERRRETLLSAARRESTVYSEIAKMALGWWSRLELSLITETARRVREQGSAVDYTSLLGLIGMLARFGEDASFPEALRQPAAETIVNATYREPGPGSAGEPESRAMLSATCEILAGQLYPQVTFPVSGESAEWHRARGEKYALDWMHARATRGFHAVSSDTVYAETVLAAVHILDFADSDALWEMASVLLDKVLFLLGANSHRGVFGTARGCTTTSGILGGYLEATSGIAKLMWGTGVYNLHFAAPVSLALMENYELPVILRTIATDTPEALWSQEHDGPETPGASSKEADLAIYRTPDFMLSAIQDARPGTAGSAEHIWQATLGPGATVFVNHPVCASLSDAQRPNFWRGNGVRPRVVQWQDALIALYTLSPDDWMGFTHAYFPIHAFDEHLLHDGWAFARKGDGYLALTAQGGLSLTRAGHSAYRELRSAGQQNVWLCQMGRAILDGDFAAFQARVLAVPPVYTANGTPGVRWTSLRGDDLELAWTGPFTKNGEITTVTTDHHINNPYCVTPFPADVMDIHYGETVMRLAFERS